MKKTREIMPRPHQSSNARKPSPQTRMHTSREPISCRGLSCKVHFAPKRKDQVFCSPGCRSEYFKIARGIGLILLEKSKCDASLKVVADGLLEILKKAG